MKFIATIIVVAGIACAGGSAVAGDPLIESFPEEQAAVGKRVHEVWEACRANDVDLLASHHLDSPKFTKWVDGATGVLGFDETVAYETGFWSQAEDFTYEVQDLQVHVFGGTAVALFVIPYELTIGGETHKGMERSTFVLVKKDGDWKIVHEHFSPVTAEP